MGKVTLVQESLAVEGKIFRYMGMDDPCSKCKVKDVCHNLETGRRYRVVKVRNKKHDCAVHEGGKITVAEVEEVPEEISITIKHCIEGAILKLDEYDCPHRWCEFNDICRDRPSSKVKITKVGESLKCPLKLKLRRCIIEREND